MSIFDDKAKSIKYSHSKVYYNDNGVIDFRLFPSVSFRFFLSRVRRKIKRFLHNINSWNSEDYYQDYFFYQCYQIAKKEKADMVINEGRGDYQQFKIFYKLIGKENVFYHVHCTMKEDYFFRCTIPNSISISKYVRDEWVKDRTIHGKNVVIYNGINIDRFNIGLPKEKRTLIRHSLGISDDEIVVIFCGRIMPEKGIDKLLDAFELLKNKPIRLLLIGSAGFSSNEQSDFSKQIITRAKSMTSVIFLGYVPNSFLPNFYQISDIQAIPSVWEEGAGLVAIEGMASGLPLIITKSGGMVEYVTDGCAIKVPIDNFLSYNLANSILWLFNNRETAKKMGFIGRKRAKEFSKEKYYNAFVKEFII